MPDRFGLTIFNQLFNSERLSSVAPNFSSLLFLGRVHSFIRVQASFRSGLHQRLVISRSSGELGSYRPTIWFIIRKPSLKHLYLSV